MRKSVLLTCILFTQILHAGNFGHFLSTLNQLPVRERQAKADSFMKANPVLPYFENDTTIIFIYQGHANTARIAGDFTGWEPSLEMNAVEGSDLHYSILHFETDARIEYKLVIDGQWILDPKNPFSFTGGMGVNSEVRMKGYTVPPEILRHTDIPHGTLHDTTVFSKKLNNSRPVKIYLPSGYSAQRKYPVIVFHDGIEYATLANMVNILDYLIAHHEIEPVIGVFVPPVDRNNEYYGSKENAFTYFIVRELMSIIDHKYATNTEPGKRATFGISAGGNIALYIGMMHPEAFGKIAAQSSSVQPAISEHFKKSSRMNLEFYLDRGKYDLPKLIPMIDGLTSILREKKYTCQFRQWHEGHSWGNWEAHARYALKQFFPYK